MASTEVSRFGSLARVTADTRANSKIWGADVGLEKPQNSGRLGVRPERKPAKTADSCSLEKARSRSFNL
jgi:hypothetical protein